MTASSVKTVAEAKDAASHFSFAQSIFARASNLLKAAFIEQRSAGVAGGQIMKNISGADCKFNERGFITELTDAEKRSWTFSYRKEQVVAFCDRQGHHWHLDGDRFVEASGKYSGFAPEKVSINHVTAEITVTDSVRCTTYRPDGSTIIVVEPVPGEDNVRLWFTEYSTRPHRAFVIVEERGSRQLVTWVQDANAKLYKFEYDAGGCLERYTDVSHKPVIVWLAQHSAEGTIISWQGQHKKDGTAIGTMTPLLESVDLAGNRHFIRSDGTRFMVGPSGAACLTEQLNAGIVTGRQPMAYMPG